MGKDEDNPKNWILETLDFLGSSKSALTFTFDPDRPWGVATASVQLPDGTSVRARGEPGPNRKAQRMSACGALWVVLEETRRDVFRSWDVIQAEAQRGDALIKFAAYLDETLGGAAGASWFLQRHESNVHLADLFDCWKDEGLGGLEGWGKGLSVERKATVVEATIWRRYRDRVLADGALDALSELRDALRDSQGA